MARTPGQDYLSSCAPTGAFCLVQNIPALGAPGFHFRSQLSIDLHTTLLLATNTTGQLNQPLHQTFVPVLADGLCQGPCSRGFRVGGAQDDTAAARARAKTQARLCVPYCNPILHGAFVHCSSRRKLYARIKRCQRRQLAAKTSNFRGVLGLH